MAAAAVTLFTAATVTASLAKTSRERAGIEVSASSAPLSTGWSSISLPSDDKTYAGKLVRAGSMLFLLGSHQDVLDNSSQVIWTSTDGRTWRRLTRDSAVFRENEQISDLTAGGPGYVAVGSQGTVWTSKDGQVWQRVPDQPAFEGAGPIAVTAGGPGLVAVGSEQAPNTPVSAQHGVVWTSKDGETWRRLPDTAGDFSGAFLFGVARGGPGLLAFGESYPAPEGVHGLIWTSKDGVRWNRVPWDSRVFPLGSSVFRVLQGARGLVAIGSNTVPYIYSLAWTSADGRKWRRVGGDPFHQGSVHAVTTGGPGFVVGGEQETDPTLWSSSDGRTWKQGPDGEVFTGNQTRINAVAALGTSLVVVGYQSERNRPESSALRVWIWSPQAGQSTPQPTPRPTTLDPKALRLRLADLPRGYHVGSQGYTNLCDEEDRPNPRSGCAAALKALGTYDAYHFEFLNFELKAHGPPFVVGMVIVVQSEAAAKAVLKVGGALIHPLGAGFKEAKALPIRARIGQETKFYGTPTWVYTYVEYACGVMWRDGRVLGAVLVGGPRKQAKKASVFYARRLWRHLRPKTSILSAHHRSG